MRDLELNIEKDRVRKIVQVKISEPKITANHDFYCVVEVSEFVKTPKEIFGSDKEQARKLSLKFAEDILSDWSVLDEHGNKKAISFS